MASQLSDLIDRVQRLADRVDNSYRRRTLDALDEAVNWYASKAPWDSLFDNETFIANGSEALVLPDRVSKPITVMDVTNETPLEPGGNDWHYYSAHMKGTQGRALEWRDLGKVPVIEQPQSPQYLVVQPNVSESFDVLVKGLVHDSNASGTAMEYYEKQETISLVGDSTYTSTTQWTKIEEISKEYGTAADIKITYGNSARPISRIPNWGTRPMFASIEFLQAPTAGTKLKVQYHRQPDRLTSENSPVHPAINEDALVWRAAGNLHWMDQEGQAANVAWQKAGEILNDQKTVQETFGERDHSIQPWTGYFNLED